MRPNTDLHFPEIMDAIAREETSRWTIGDRLLERFGRPPHLQSDLSSFRAVSAEAEELGFNPTDWTPEYLRDLRNLSFQFPPETRVPGIAFTCYYEAQTPKQLHAIVQAAEKSGVKVTTSLIRMVKRNSERLAEHQRRSLGQAITGPGSDMIDTGTPLLPQNAMRQGRAEFDEGEINLFAHKLLDSAGDIAALMERQLKALTEEKFAEVPTLSIDAAIADYVATQEMISQMLARLRKFTRQSGRGRLSTVA